jgi:hypothetical protein
MAIQFLNTVAVDTNVLYVDTSSDRVGVGTTSPNQKLDVNGSIQLAQYGYIYFGSNSSNQFLLSNSLSGSQITQTGSGNLELQSASNSIYFKSGGTTKAVITSTGEFGIGTTNPSQKLDVNGNVTANRYYGNSSTTFYLDPNDSVTAARLAGGLEIGYGSAGEYRIEVGEGRTGNGYAYIDLVGDTTYSDYGLRIIRNNSGANTSSQFVHRGTGTLNFKNWDAAHMTFDTSNIERMRIQSGGNVGIGTTNPSRKLSVSGAIELSGVDTVISTGNPAIRRGNSGEMFLDAPGNVTVTIDSNNNQTTALFNVRKDSGTELFRIQENGNVGIGTTSPSKKLDVNGRVRVGDINYAYGGTNYHVLLAEDSNDAYISNINGNATISGGGYYYGSNLRLLNSTSTSYSGIQARADGAIAFENATGGTAGSTIAVSEKMRINGSGDVGIGTTAPSEKLEVVGNAVLDNSNAKLKIKAGGTGTVGSIDFTFNTDSTQYGLIDLNYNSRATQGFRIKSLYPLTLDAVTNQKFLISGSEKMLINSSGNVGIGTGGNVDERLHIQGSVDNDDIALKIENTFDNNSSANPPSAAVLFQTASNNGHIRVFGAPADTAANHRMDIGATASTSYLTFSPSNTEKMRIASSGKVGIGTTNPDGLLHVSSGTSGDAVVIIESDTDNSNENDNPHVELRQDGGGIKAKLGIEGNAGNTYSNSLSNATYLGTVFQQSLQFITGNTGNVQTAKMTIQPNTGNVGIGTTNPLAKLQVNGGIQLANDTSSPSLYKAGTFRYRTSGNNSYVDMCMQTGASTYAWVNIVTNSW